MGFVGKSALGVFDYDGPLIQKVLASFRMPACQQDCSPLKNLRSDLDLFSMIWLPLGALGWIDCSDVIESFRIF